MPRGGARSGRPGGTYSNRSDLQTGPRLAPTAQTNQPYGVAGQQLASQQQIPMSAPAPAPIPLSAPSSRPNEPIQAGLSTGPGPGPDSIPAIAPNAPDPDTLQFAKYLPALELMTTLPGATSTVRNLVRRLRGAVPPGTEPPA